MEHRRYLGGLGVAVAGLSGCVAAPATTGGPRGCPGTAPQPGDRGFRSAATGDLDLPVPRSALVRGTTRDAIPAITDPAFAADWSDLARSLDADDLVVGVARGGRARAYPVATLSTYEVVNDDVGGPLLVTFCPLCASGMTAVREVGGQETVFGVSGYLFRSNLVLYDRLTDSLWSQIGSRAIRGPATGTRFTLVPSALATWADWRGEYPETEVLLPPPESGTIANTREAMPRGVHGEVGVVEVAPDFADDRLPKTAVVIGVATPSAARAYPRERVAAAGVVNDCLDGLPVVVATRNLPQAYDRRVDGEVRRFERAGPDRLRAGGSEWAITSGRAVSGPYEGRQLARAGRSATMFWFAWLDFYPETTVWRQ